MKRNWNHYIFLIFLSLVVYQTSLANSQCELLFEEDALAGSYEMPNPLNMVLFGIPKYASRARRPVDSIDAELMARSYYDLDRGQPREHGIIQLKGKDGRILLQSAIVPGVHGSIWLNEAIFQILRQGAPFVDNVAAIVITHTHPMEFARSTINAKPHVFSQNDFIQDKKLFDVLATDQVWKNIAIESYIVFLKSNVTRIPVGAPREQFQPYMNIRGYRLSR
jgi:hypothetical protein